MSWRLTRRRVIGGITLGLAALAAGMFAYSRALPGPDKQATLEKLVQPLTDQGMEAGQPVFMRIFKLERELELWLRNGPKFSLFRTYPICAYSGDLGPKLKEGDRQAPEGFYSVRQSSLNPNSSFHLSFNLGFPNVYDRAHGRTGSYLMVHGACASIGCYAMTDEGITEIYGLAEAALNRGQSTFSVHIFPFRMTEANLARHADSPWSDFWSNLREGYDLFETTHLPPDVSVRAKRYHFSSTET